MLHKIDEKMLKINLSKETFTEIRVLAVRKDVEPRDIIVEIIDNHINKMKDKSINKN